MAEIDLSSISALPVEERIKLAQAIWNTIPEPAAERTAARSWNAGEIDAASWAAFFGKEALLYLHHVDDQLPYEAHRFLQTCGLPKSMLFEGNHEQSISFAPLADPIVGYNSLIGWGIFFDSELDARMSQQLVIGHVNSEAGVASFCVEKTTGAVNLVNIAAIPPQTLANSSILQFAQSLQTAVEWSRQREEYRTIPADFIAQLEDRLRSIDRNAFASADNYWPSVIRTIDHRQGMWRVLGGGE
ncbi:SUKH-4 family immunity protein [Blastopirellula sp. JC732]|uniref:SUKH-4 family immunity protein n=1 Tax=Blastopirellula sediminis TaxID=2894196 RepID=A0A9X1MPD8_9BACT|nr:SUKH-4 family immunity protein [Blastopirellula sediminis]MCC9605807.1 SUKH-4 family immunity protein [Blastopirellula sediminis]MCC9630893.1 SUKH-4 family immunity protein [Blastopirellula sediminis]